MYFPHAFRKDFFVQSSAAGDMNTLLSGTATTALTAGKIGFFKATSQAGTNSTLVSTSTAATTPFYIIQGSYFASDKIGPVHGGYKESIKSKMINPKYISRVMTVSAKAPLQNVVQIPLASSNNGLACDTTYRLRIDVKGSPALRFLSHNMYRTLDSYTGCCNTSNPTLQKDPVVTLLNWKDQINNSPIFNTMVQARVYKLNTSAGSSGTATSTGVGTPTTTSCTITVTNTGMVIGDKVVGVGATGIPANSFITGKTSTTAITITYPAQQTAPTITTGSFKVYSDVYTEASTVAYIPGTGTTTINCGASTVNALGTATGLTSSAYSAAADAASFSVDAHLELTAAYMETKFGTCTFTPTDKYDLEPLFIYSSIVDETGDPCSTLPFITSHSNTGADGTANDNTVIQKPVQASGTGETLLRNMILSNRYLQNAYPDSSRVESLRMREIEQDPALSIIDRGSLYDQVMVLHSVPRFNNPTGTFDNDQYLLVINVPTGTTTTAFTNFLVSSANAAQGTSAVVLETY